MGFPILAKTKPATFSPFEMRANQCTREFKRKDVYMFLVLHVKHTSGTKHVAITKTLST